ncbi:8708_t:CDS:2 [Cetraspora pellucida]|uniref:8708_t:CDS:1 n=1 Tax=Cetraspora pellucida TaxID=1433469 RepID=A0A9N9CB23_9GLOM|nr:8708_t:CDS:2 [Cetraspora pellucida]
MATDVSTTGIEVEPLEHKPNEQKLVEKKGTTSGVKSFLAGGFGGMSAVLVGHPFDLVKVRLQTAPEGTYTGTIDVVKKTIAKDGLRGLYRGMGPPLAGITPIFAISFWVELSTLECTIAGGISAGPTTLVMAPVERIKVLLQIQGQGGDVKYKGPLDVIRHLYKEGGLRSIFRGTSATFLRDFPGSAAYFGAYEFTKKLLTSSDSTLNPAAVLFAGGMAGVAMWTICIPPDVVKSRLQSAPAGQYKGFMDVLRHLLKTDGPSALFKGLGPALLRAFPANAAAFMGYEASLKVMDKLW